MLRILICFHLLTGCLNGWWSGGHLTVAQIAYEHLEPEVRQKMDSYIDVLTPFYPESNTFVKASNWLDELGPHDLQAFATWHYTNFPYDPDSTLEKDRLQLIAATNENADIVFALEQAIKTLQSKKAKAFEKGLCLRLLIHLVADAHQPLHTTSLYSEQFPHGDLGGNEFKIISPVANNLHAFWDAALGAVPELGPTSPFSEEKIHEIGAYAYSLMEKYPPENLPIQSTPSHWVDESHQLASSLVYTIAFNTEPSEEYIEAGKSACEKRLALAGYRLAYILNTLAK